MPHHIRTTSTAPHALPMRNRVLALAAMVQCTCLVQGIARKGVADALEIEACLASIFAPAGSSADEMYGGPSRLRTGLIMLGQVLQGEDVKKAKELMAYTAAMISLERRLSRNPKILKQLADGMTRIEKQCEFFKSFMHGNVIAAIAGLYGDTISTMKPRIIVRGKPEYLRHTGNTNKVRALLLAGIRAAHLWRTHGGRRFQLIIRRRSLTEQVQKLLREASRA